MDNERQLDLQTWVECLAATRHCMVNNKKSYYFIDQFLNFVDLEKDYFHVLVKQLQDRFNSIISNNDELYVQPSRVPPITHRIWITDPHNGCNPPADDIANFLKFSAEIRNDTMHYLWTNNREIEAALKNELKGEMQSNIEIANIESIDDPLLGTVNNLIKSRKFVLAADLMKVAILYRFGGVYSDLGLYYDKKLFNLVRKADYTFRYGGSFFQSSFIACARRSRIMSVFRDICTYPQVLDRSYALMGSSVKALDEVNIFSGVGLTVTLMLFLPATNHVLVIPPTSSHMASHSQRSWYGDAPKHGNVLISESEATVLNIEAFEEAARISAAQFNSVDGDKMAREKLKIEFLIDFLKKPS